MSYDPRTNVALWLFGITFRLLRGLAVSPRFSGHASTARR
jgi:hypothetical protein